MVFSGFFDDEYRSRPRFTAKEKDALYKSQKGICLGCRKKVPMGGMQVDHIKPLSRGGGERLTNLQLLCGRCNAMKGDGTMAELRKRLKAKDAPKKRSTNKPKRTRTRRRSDPFGDFFGF